MQCEKMLWTRKKNTEEKELHEKEEEGKLVGGEEGRWGEGAGKIVVV